MKRKHSPMVASNMTDLSAKFNKNIRPLLDAVDRLRNLKVPNEGIPLPSIVVVGDQSSGKSSVLESLATISLPRGQGIATRVPLVLRLQSCRGSEDSSITISYKDTELSIQEDDIESQVEEATNVLAGTGKGVVTDTAISLHIRKPGAPDLNMIDLPGITRVPVHGQPADIYEQIAAMIRKYLKPQETVILNVLSATVDFSTCESIRMSQEEDRKGERTLAVVTKVDRAADEVYEKVTADDVNIGSLGYICVRNRIDEDGSHEEAREQERKLFDTHLSLSQLNKSSVGIPALAERLTQIQANIIRMSLPDIQQKIDKALIARRRELEAVRKGELGDGDPTNVFFNVLDKNKTLMQNVMLHGNYDSFVDRKEMHYPARLAEMFRKFSENLHEIVEKVLPESKTAEILHRMTEMRGLTLPTFLSPTLMKSLVSEEVDKVSEVVDIVLTTSEKECLKYVYRVLEKERSNVFTMNDYYMANVKKIRHHVTEYTSGKNRDFEGKIEGFTGFINLQETRVNSRSNEYLSAFDMKVNLAAYCKVVHKRVSDDISLELRHSLEDALLRSPRSDILKTKAGQDVSILMEENASTVQKRLTLRKRVDVLTECKAVLQQLF